MSDVSTIEVDVIIPVHNAASTVKEAVLSALNQEIPSSSSSRDAPSPRLQAFLQKYSISVTVCCYDDRSKDESLSILRQIESSRSEQNGATKTEVTASRRPTTKPTEGPIPSLLIVGSSNDGEPRGAGYARNRAIEMNNPSLRYFGNSGGGAKSNESHDYVKDTGNLKFLCLLDSDDIMHKNRIIEQVLFMMTIVNDEARNKTILGSTFDRDPPGSTWHYSNWANNLTDERLMLERYREITVLQPTWFMPLSVWWNVGGYIEAPPLGTSDTVSDFWCRLKSSGSSSLQKSYLIHPKFDTLSSIRLAEDLRFFHSHLESNGNLRLHRTSLATNGERVLPLVTYRHMGNDQSQSFRTSRKLLLQLRALAFQRRVIRVDPFWNTGEKKFGIWGCGRDGKDFFKALDQDLQERVYCFVDVDAKKLNAGYYVDTTSHRAMINATKGTNGVGKSDKKQRDTARKIPIVHFSFLIPDQQEQEIVRSEWVSNYTAGKTSILGCIDKSKSGSTPCSSKTSQPKKKQKFSTPITAMTKLQDRKLDRKLLSQLPVVVCVAMYRTNGVLESNVTKICRIEGENLWHFS